MIEEIEESDYGKWVEYNNGYKREIGRIKSWNDYFIFVVYKCSNDWADFSSYTGAATSPEDLTFINDPRI